MAVSFGSLRTTKKILPPIGVLYGVHGVGKTALAAEFPSPLYLPTAGEEPPEGLDLATYGTAESFNDVLNTIEFLLTNDHEHGTLIIDSLDGVEPLIWRNTCQKNGWGNIEDAGFGKGYVAADEDWRDLLSGVLALREAGIATVMLAHCDITRFDSPTSDPYSRYGIKLHKRASALVQEAAQFVGFINYRHTIKEKDVGFNKKVGHAEGSGERQIHLEERPGFLAKNRYSMPPSITYRKGQGYDALAKYFPTGDGTSQAANDNQPAGRKAAA